MQPPEKWGMGKAALMHTHACTRLSHEVCAPAFTVRTARQSHDRTSNGLCAWILVCIFMSRLASSDPGMKGCMPAGNTPSKTSCNMPQLAVRSNKLKDSLRQYSLFPPWKSVGVQQLNALARAAWLQLLGKLLVDLDAMREESVNTVRQEEAEERQRIKESMANRAGECGWEICEEPVETHVESDRCWFRRRLRI
eukprot:1159623-Pelagomonas_calceolata.AAC.3